MIVQEKIPNTIVLFGSRAKGTASERSDTDVGILDVHSLSDDERAVIVLEVAQKLGVSEDTIDLVNLTAAPVLLQYEAAKYGKLIFGDPKRFLRFRVGAWRRYWDTAKLRRVKLEALKKQYA